MAAETSSVVVAFAGLMLGGLCLALALLDGAPYMALGALGMTVFCGSEFLSRADFNALS
jgi:hypothetical protein